jgi:hypothetical protein
MNTLMTGMSVAGFLVVMGTWGIYIAKIPAGKVPIRPIGSIILQCIGITLSLSAVLWSFNQSSGLRIAVVLPAIPALMMGVLFLLLLTQRRTPIGDLKVKEGDKILPFKAFTSEGLEFHTDELAGKRILLKFFRGGW